MQCALCNQPIRPGEAFVATTHPASVAHTHCADAHAQADRQHHTRRPLLTAALNSAILILAWAVPIEPADRILLALLLWTAHVYAYPCWWQDRLRRLLTRLLIWRFRLLHWWNTNGF